MIELVSEVDSKITACRHIMQPIGTRLVPSMLAAGAKRKVARVEIFCKIELRNPNSLFIPPAFLLFVLILLGRHQHFKRLALNNQRFNLFNV